MKNKLLKCLVVASAVLLLSACGNNASREDIIKTYKIGTKLTENQPTPVDIDYSLERYNLIKRAYWVNGQREKALGLKSAIVRPMGYIVLMSGSAVVAEFTVDGKVSSLNSFLTPDSEYYESKSESYNKWIADVDGSYGENNNGIFFFTTDGEYVEWNGQYIYTDSPIHISNPVIHIDKGE